MTLHEREILTGYGLSDLGSVPLSTEQQEALARMKAEGKGVGLGLGSAVWCARKLAEVVELFALERVAARMQVLALDVSTELKALVRLRVKAPCMVDGELTVTDEVLLALRYPEEILRQPLPGYALVQVQQPRQIWHSNVSDDPAQRLCLGANVPKGYPLREAVLGSYAALSLQSITLDGSDPAGVMNPMAVRFWNEHAERIPLSREAFLDPPAPEGTDAAALERQESGEGAR